MEKQLPPVRVIAPGSAYRRDEIDATHLSAFNQLEMCIRDRIRGTRKPRGGWDTFIFGEKESGRTSRRR